MAVSGPLSTRLLVSLLEQRPTCIGPNNENMIVLIIQRKVISLEYIHSSFRQTSGGGRDLQIHLYLYGTDKRKEQMVNLSHKK